eukprot:scaffold2068_cov226-Pinguiococcus_pyrenoidosus.AAC.1
MLSGGKDSQSPLPFQLPTALRGPLQIEACPIVSHPMAISLGLREHSVAIKEQRHRRCAAISPRVQRPGVARPPHSLESTAACQQLKGRSSPKTNARLSDATSGCQLITEPNARTGRRFRSRSMADANRLDRRSP